MSAAEDHATRPSPMRRRLRRASRVALGGTAALALLIAVLATGHGELRRYDEGQVLCPFLAMSPPDESNLLRFARDASRNGMDYPMALVVAMQVTYLQKGLWALLTFEAPDLDRLDEVEGISHEDRYARYLPELRHMAEERAVDGRITLQDLVAMKEWVAAQAGVAPISEPSRIETALLFIRAGGDFDAWTVSVDEVFRLLSGQRPTVDAVVSPGALDEVRAKARWGP
ncbi:MAG: hypothetical protein AAGH15_04880 [Myxococcota bacterium]